MRPTLWIAAAYLLGSVPFSYLAVRWARGVDVRSVGSGNVGATNVLRAAGKGWALGALLLDAVKGLLPVLLGLAAGLPAETLGGIGLAAVLGHVFPLFLGFRGGKGVATAAGALAGLSPWAMAAGTAVFGVVAALTRIASVASMSAALTVAVVTFAMARRDLVHGGMATASWCLAIVALVLLCHAGNLRRLLRGVEPRVGRSVERGE